MKRHEMEMKRKDMFLLTLFTYLAIMTISIINSIETIENN